MARALGGLVAEVIVVVILEVKAVVVAGLVARLVAMVVARVCSMVVVAMVGKRHRRAACPYTESAIAVAA